MAPEPSKTESISARRTRRRIRLAWATFLVFAAFVLVLAERYRMVIVIGNSMEPTFRSGDVVWADRHAYDSENPRESDVVVAWVGDQAVLKRVVGLPGEAVEVRSGVVYVDDEARPSPAPPPAVGMDVERGVLAKDKYAILGDNRVHSSNPTIHAIIPKEAIVGRVVSRWSLRLRNERSTGP